MKSDNLQIRGPPPLPHSSLSPPARVTAPAPAPPQDIAFKTRYPSACKECRRRKQKCSLTQPCTNCARRFPQPACEYGIEKVKRSPHAPASDPRSNASQSGGLYAHLDMDAVHDAILQVDEAQAPAGKLPGTPDSALSLVGHNPSSAGYQPNQGVNQYLRTRRQTPNPEQLLRLRFRDKSGILQGQDIIELLQFLLQTRLKVTNSIVQDEWQIDGVNLLRASQESTPPSAPVSRFDDEIRYLPMVPSQMNKELVRTHLQLMSRFKASLDGSPRPNNRFMKHWIPISIQDPLILHVVLCSTASFLHETGRVPKTMLFIHRKTVMRMLNDHISNPQLCTDDSAMLAVAQSILTSWYWGSTEELHAHMAGFKRMIQMRGSIQNLGMEGFTSKVALIDDFVIALAHETEPLMFGEPGFAFEDPVHVPLQVNFNSPLLFDCPPFLSPASQPLRLHPYTAQILDDMRTLTKAVVDLPEHPSEDDLDGIYKTAISVLRDINHWPEDVSLAQHCDTSNGPGCSVTGSKRKRPGDDTLAPRKAGTAEVDGPASRSEDAPDLVYRCVRTTALIYCRAILHRVPTSRVFSETEFCQLWNWAWTAGLNRWSSLSGIFAWIMIAAVASSLQTVHGRMTKTLMVTTFMYIGTEDWHIATDLAKAGLKLQRWLRGEQMDVNGGAVSRAFGGESVIERHGFAFKDALPEVVPKVYDEDEELESVR